MTLSIVGDPDKCSHLTYLKYHINKNKLINYIKLENVCGMDFTHFLRTASQKNLLIFKVVNCIVLYANLNLTEEVLPAV